MLPIPGTQSIDPLKANILSAAIELSDDEFSDLSKAGYSTGIASDT
jgi:aryl-alcohol dehydrogenase-like predicted oxidoreductase